MCNISGIIGNRDISDIKLMMSTQSHRSLDQPDRSNDEEDFIKIFFSLPLHAQNVVCFSLISLSVRKFNITRLNHNQIKVNRIEFWVKSKKKN